MDRKKDMFISGGENVYPAEIEKVLYQHPAVHMCAVIGLPDPKWGEVGKACVVLKPNQTATEEELLKFMTERLAKYKVPKSVSFMEALPISAAGKISSANCARYLAEPCHTTSTPHPKENNMSTVPTLPGITSKMIDTPRLKMHVLFSGPENGTPVLFIHGNASSATYWEEIMLKLPAGFRGIAPDLRGYGDTEDKLIDATRGMGDWVDDLLGLLDALKIEKTHVVGHSMGGTIVFGLVGALQRTCPERNRRQPRFALWLRRLKGSRWHALLR